MLNTSARKMLFLAKLKTWLRDDLLFIVIGLFGFIILLSPLLIIYMCYKSKIWILVWLAYFLWTEYDAKTVKRGGRWIKGSKNLTIYRHLWRYYPLRLIKTADLTPDRNYVLASFPHAVVPSGACVNFLTNTTKVDELFPGVDIRGATMPVFFRFPLFREIIMANGLITTNKENILYLLNGPPSTAILIFPGGLKELFLSQPGNVYTIVKNNRKGFIKIALESGSSLVPVFSFGDINLLEIIEFKSPILVYLNEWIYKFTRGKLGMCRGRRIFGWDLGIIIPRRGPVNTVVGKPIEVPKVENPSDELVDEYHEKFYKALYDLFEEYKVECDVAGEAAQLIMV